MKKLLNISNNNDIPNDFNWKVYLVLNPDVAAIYTDKQSVINHYIHHGRQEKRQYLIDYSLLPVDFDWKFYLDHNLDVMNTVGCNEHGAITHYLQFGHKEERIYKPLNDDDLEELSKLEHSILHNTEIQQDDHNIKALIDLVNVQTVKINGILWKDIYNQIKKEYNILKLIVKRLTTNLELYLSHKDNDERYNENETNKNENETNKNENETNKNENETNEDNKTSQNTLNEIETINYIIKCCSVVTFTEKNFPFFIYAFSNIDVYESYAHLSFEKQKQMFFLHYENYGKIEKRALMNESFYYSYLLPKHVWNNQESFHDTFYNFPFIVVFDFNYYSGGAYTFLQQIMEKYSKDVHFIIVRKNKILSKASQSKDSVLSSFCLDIFHNDQFLIAQNVNLRFIDLLLKTFQYNLRFVFFNSLANFTTTEKQELVHFLRPYKVFTISHDYSLFFNDCQMYPHNFQNLHQIIPYDFYDRILVQHSCNIINMKLPKNKCMLVPLPDYSLSSEPIQYSDKMNHNELRILMIGNLSYVKGSHILKELIDTINKMKNTNANFIKIHLLGSTDLNELDYLHNKFYGINDFISKVKEIEPHFVIDLSLWSETYSYTLSLALSLNIPIFCKKKHGFSSVVEHRLQESCQEYYLFHTIPELIQFIYSTPIRTTFTVPLNSLQYPNQYDLIFKGKCFDNIVIITSKIIVSNVPLSYSKKRSIYCSNDRFQQTLQSIDAIRQYFPKLTGILLFDNSQLSDNHITLLKQKVDFFISMKDAVINQFDDIDVNYFTNKSIYKSEGEISQTIALLSFIQSQNLQFHNLFKLSGRYLINEHFQFKTFDNDQIIFKEAQEVYEKHHHVQNYFYTCFYKIHQKHLVHYLQALRTMLLSHDSKEEEESKKHRTDLEKVLFPLFQRLFPNQCILIDKLGITQNIATWVKDDYLEQHTI